MSFYFYFQLVFADFESAIQTGNSFKSYGVSLTTLEDVFLSISNDVEPLVDGDSPKNHTITVESTNHSGEKNLIEDFGDVHISKWATLCSLSKLRMYRLMRSPQSVFFMLLLPLILVACALEILKINKKLETNPFIVLSDPSSKSIINFFLH